MMNQEIRRGEIGTVFSGGVRRLFGRLSLICIVAAYVCAFNLIYILYLYPRYQYFGFELNIIGSGMLLTIGALAVVPSLWLPLKVCRPSQLVYWTLFLIVYIPSLFVPAYVQLQPLGRILWLDLTLFAGFVVLGLGYLIKPVQLRCKSFSARSIWILIAVVTLLLYGHLLLIYWGHFRLVSFQHVYEELRSSGSAVGAGTLVGYSIAALGGTLNPFFIVVGLMRGSKNLILLGALGQMLLYMTAGDKIYALSPIIIGAVFLVLKSGRLVRFGFYFPLALVVLSVTIGLLYELNIIQIGGMLDGLVPIVFLRIMANGGFNTALYYNYFESHPYTYYSHIHGINQLVTYPYPDGLGQMIGFYYSGSNEWNNNAHFWATDGIAACGLPGILIISVIGAGLFWLLDSVAARHTDALLASLLCVFPTMLLANSSLFTTVWSGGLGGCMLLMLLLPDKPVLPTASASGTTAARAPSL